MMPRMWCAAALLLGVWSAAPVDRLSAQTLRVPYTTFTLPNGLQVLFHEDPSVPVVAVNPWYPVGSSDGRAGRPGFADRFAQVRCMGSELVRSGECARRLEAPD